MQQMQKENAELKRKLEEQRLFQKKEFYANLLFYGLLNINILVIMTQKWDITLLYFLLMEALGLFVWTGWAYFWESRKS